MIVTLCTSMKQVALISVVTLQKSEIFLVTVIFCDGWDCFLTDHAFAKQRLKEHSSTLEW